MKHPRVALLLAAVFGFTSLWAQPTPAAKGAPGDSRQKQQREFKPGSRLDNLNLTDKQKDEMQKLRSTFEKKNIAERAKIDALRVDLREAVMTENPDKGTIEKLVQNIADLEAQQKLARIEHLFEVRAILTPEQQKQFKLDLRELGGPGGRPGPGGMEGRSARGHRQGMGPQGGQFPPMGQADAPMGPEYGPGPQGDHAELMPPGGPDQDMPEPDGADTPPPPTPVQND